MTSKISFLKLMQEDAKRRNWMLVFLTVLFFVCYPVLMMIGLDNMMTVNDAWRERVALEVLAPGNIGMALVMTVAAAMIAASEFAYLHSKEKMDLYYSIPVRRKKLFMSGYMTGFLMFVGIFVASEILAVLVAAAKGVSPSLLWLPFLKGSVLHIIEFLFIYSAAAFAMLFTGNTVIAVFGMMVIAGYGPAVAVITEAYIDLGFYTALKHSGSGKFLIQHRLVFCFIWSREFHRERRGIRRYFFTCFVQDTGTAASGCTEKSWRNPALFSDAGHLSTVSCTVFSRGTDYISGNRDFICRTIRGGKDHAGKTLGEVQKCQDHLQ